MPRVRQRFPPVVQKARVLHNSLHPWLPHPLHHVLCHCIHLHLSHSSPQRKTSRWSNYRLGFSLLPFITPLRCTLLLLPPLFSDLGPMCVLLAFVNAARITPLSAHAELVSSRSLPSTCSTRHIRPPCLRHRGGRHGCLTRSFKLDLQHASELMFCLKSPKANTADLLSYPFQEIYKRIAHRCILWLIYFGVRFNCSRSEGGLSRFVSAYQLHML